MRRQTERYLTRERSGGFACLPKFETQRTTTVLSLFPVNIPHHFVNVSDVGEGKSTGIPTFPSEAGSAEVQQLRRRVAEEDARKIMEKKEENDEMDMDGAVSPVPVADGPVEPAGRMDVDEQGATGEAPASELEKKEELSTMQADDDGAVEY